MNKYLVLFAAPGLSLLYVEAHSVVSDLDRVMFLDEGGFNVAEFRTAQLIGWWLEEAAQWKT